MNQKFYARAATAPTTLDSTNRTVNLLWTGGGRVTRFDYGAMREYIEDLPASTADLSRLMGGAPVLADHDNRLESVIGVVERAWVEGADGWATIRFSAREDVESIFADVSAGIIRNVSVGYQVEQYEVVNDPTEPLPIYRATRWLPMEISLVAVPADAAAQIRSLPTNEATTMTTEAVKTDSPAEIAPVVDTTTIEKRAATEERNRIAGIRAFAANSRTKPEMVERLIEEGVSLATAKERMIEAWAAVVDSESSRSHVEVSVTEDEADKRRDAVVDALLGRAGLLSGKERAAKMQGNPYANRKLLDIARESLERSGVKTSYLSQMEIVGRGFTQSTSDFPVLLENTMHKALLGSYAVVADTWRRFCRTGSVSDFRAWKRLKTGSIGSLDAKNELGEFVNKTIPDGEAESVQATTRGNIINISREAVINDDLSYFAGLSADLGRAAARTVESAVYAKLVANPTLSDSVALFHASHGNLAGTGAAPTVTTIDAGRQAMAIQTDVGGNDYLDIRPSIAVVPVSLGGEFRVLNAAEYDVNVSPGSTTGKNTMTPNRVRGLLTDIVDSPRLSGNAWYLFADPVLAPVLEVVFLDGNESPYIELQNGFTVDGAAYKVRLDFGVGVVDYRGAYKNAGA